MGNLQLKPSGVVDFPVSMRSNLCFSSIFYIMRLYLNDSNISYYLNFPCTDTAFIQVAVFHVVAHNILRMNVIPIFLLVRFVNILVF